jgi:hypothetical protein
VHATLGMTRAQSHADTVARQATRLKLEVVAALNGGHGTPARKGKKGQQNYKRRHFWSTSAVVTPRGLRLKNKLIKKKTPHDRTWTVST